MKALLARTFLFLLRRNYGDTTSSASKVETPPLDFNLLPDQKKLAIKQYFDAAINVVVTISAIRRKAAVDVDTVLTAFQRAERGFIMAGMRPIFPAALYKVESFDATRLIQLGLLDTLGETESPVLYSPGISRHVKKLIVKYQARELDSTSYNPVS